MATASGTWKMLSPFLDPVVRDKVHIWGPKEWHTKILAGPGPPPIYDLHSVLHVFPHPINAKAHRYLNSNV